MRSVIITDDNAITLVHLAPSLYNIFSLIFLHWHKLPEDIYKSHLEAVRPTLNAATLDSARANLAASYVNGLVNCGFGKEKLLQETPKEVPWLCKQKEFGMF